MLILSLLGCFASCGGKDADTSDSGVVEQQEETAAEIEDTEAPIDTAESQDTSAEDTALEDTGE